MILVDKVKDREKRFWYAEKTLENGWSKVVLEHQIELQLYERQADSNIKLTNFDKLLPDVQGELATDLMKDPYIFELEGIKEKAAEKDIEKAMIEKIKNVDFEPAFIGQLQFYVTAVDETIKKEMDNPTIGLLLCKEKDKLSVEWALKSANVPVGVASYEVRQYLPTEEEINRLISIGE